MLTGGGGRGALQSGMFTVEKAETPYVVSQEGVGKYVLPSGAGLSRLGAEGYYGIVSPLDSRTLEPNEAISRYAGTTGKYNLANYVSQIPAGKAEAPGAKIPWGVEGSAPALSYMDERGIIEGSALTIPGESGRLVGSKVIAGAPTYGAADAGALPTPFVSTSKPSTTTVATSNEYKPSGFLGLGGLLPEIPTIERFKAYSVSHIGEVRTDPVSAMYNLAKDEFGAPVSTAGGVASRLSLGASEIIFKPEQIVVDTGKTSSVKTEMFDLPTTKSIETTNLPTSSTMSGGNQTITNLGNWLTGNKGSIDLTNKTAVDEYNAKADVFTQMQKQNPLLITTIGGTKTTTTETGGTKLVTTITGESGQKVYASEWDRFVEGSGRVARWATGETLAKQEAYKTTLAGDTSIGGEAQRALFTIGTTVINKPAELAPAAILGWATAGAGAAAPSFLAEVGAGSGLSATAANFLLTPGGASLAKAGVVGAFGGAYTYGVTDKFTATPEQTKTNIYTSIPTLAAMYGGAGGLNWLGETRFVTGASTPSGSTFGGVNIRDTYFGAGRTPTGERYAGAFSPTESYVFTRGVNPIVETAARASQQLKLPSGTDGADASTYQSSFEGPNRDYAHMDISGGARPFSMKTAPEAQAASTVKFRDTSAGAAPFSMKTHMETITATPKTEIQPTGDISGRSQPFSVKTASEVNTGYWDTVEQIPRGDISGKGNLGVSIKSYEDVLSERPMGDVSGKGEPIKMRSQEEILSTWEQERATREQGVANVQWINDIISKQTTTAAPSYTIKNVVDKTYTPQYENLPGMSEDMFTTGSALDVGAQRLIATSETGQVVGATAFEMRGNELFVKSMGSRQSGVGSAMTEELKGIADRYGATKITGEFRPAASGFWEKMGATVQPQFEGGGTQPFEIKMERGYASPSDKTAFTINGASETALQSELNSMHPAFRDQAMSTGMQADLLTMNPAFRQYAMSKGIEKELLSMHPEYSKQFFAARGSSQPSITSIEDRGYPYTEIERQAIVRGYTNIKGLDITTLQPSGADESLASRKLTTVVPSIFDAALGSVTPYSNCTVSTTPYKTTTPTEIITPYSKIASGVSPYSIVTPSEKIIPSVSQYESGSPWERITEIGGPSKFITPVPPLGITPLVSIALPPSFSGGGGTGFGRKRRKSFLEVFTMGLDIAGPIMKLTSPPKPKLPTKTGGSEVAKSMKGKWSKNIKMPKVPKAKKK